MNDLTQYTENDLTAVADRIRKNALNNNDELAKLLAAQPGMVTRFLPNQFQRQQLQISLDQARQLANDHSKMMELYFKIRLELLKNDGDALIIATGNRRKTELTKIVAVNIEQIEMTIKQSRETFMQKMAPHLDELEKYQAYPMLYNRAKKSAETQIDNFMNTIDQLLFDFKNSLRSRMADHH